MPSQLLYIPFSIRESYVSQLMLTLLLFLLITADHTKDIDIPNLDMSFGTLELAQALGDYEALIGRGRRVLRVHLDKVKDVGGLIDLID